MDSGLRQADSQCRSDKRCLAKEVAVLAIAMKFHGLALIICIRFFGLPLMLMTMVAEMRGMPLFMFAIDGRCCPGVLERQNRQQQNHEKFFHGRNNNILWLAHRAKRRYPCLLIIYFLPYQQTQLAEFDQAGASRD